MVVVGVFVEINFFGTIWEYNCSREIHRTLHRMQSLPLNGRQALQNVHGKKNVVLTVYE